MPKRLCFLKECTVENYSSLFHQLPDVQKGCKIWKMPYLEFQICLIFHSLPSFSFVLSTSFLLSVKCKKLRTCMYVFFYNVAAERHVKLVHPGPVACQLLLYAVSHLYCYCRKRHISCSVTSGTGESPLSSVSK
jgi:hypothetical protein